MTRLLSSPIRSPSPQLHPLIKSKFLLFLFSILFFTQAGRTMSSYDQHQAPPTAVYSPPPGQISPQIAEGYSGNYVAPPPVGYPVNGTLSTQQAPVETKSRGEGFWEGCCAAICCCCAIDICL